MKRFYLSPDGRCPWFHWVDHVGQVWSDNGAVRLFRVEF